MKVTVIGGGLAGMNAALRLAARGYEVDLYEASTRLGGKAGANQHGTDYDEHGYHIFPLWYRNVWKLVDELSIKDHFIDRSEFLQFTVEGQYKNFTILKNITSWRYVWENLTSKVLSFPQMVLFFYTTLDLITQPYSYRSSLDQITVTGFVRSRFLRTEEVATQFQDLMLKGISCPAYEVSAMTMRNVLRYWIRYPEPMYRILNGNLQQLFIKPLEEQLHKHKCKIHLQQKLEKICVKDGKVSSLNMYDSIKDKNYELDVDRVIVAVPVEVIAGLIDDELYKAAPSLGRLHQLRARSMAAFNIYFKRKLDIRAEHSNLLGSKYGLSFIDVGQVWEGYNKTILNIIASDFTALESLSPKLIEEELFSDLQHYIPDITWDDVEKIDLQPHLDAPLFMNDCGAWHYRPGMDPTEEDVLRKELPNLYLAGDYCRSEIDLVCMEGATTTGLLAAEALRKDCGMGSEIKLEPHEIPFMPLMVLGKILLFPVALIMRVFTLLGA